MLKNKKGFSLVELMIVVAIIGILAAVAVPNFKRFQAKSKQAEAKGLLSAYYTAATASHAEFGIYGGNFSVIGFRPDGKMTYRLVATDNANAASYAGYDASCVTTAAAAADCPAGYITWTENTNSVAAKNAAATTTACSNHAFEAYVVADIGKGASGAANAGNDEWEINEQKLFTNTQDGLP